VYEAVAQCRQFLVIGAAVSTEPWAGLLSDAKRVGARTVEFATERNPASASFDESVIGPLTDNVPEYIKRLIADL